MYYQAIVTQEGDEWLAEFPDCPGCQTFANSRPKVIKAAAEALDGWLETTLAAGDIPQLPSLAIFTSTDKKQSEVVKIEVSESLTSKVKAAILTFK